MEFVCLLRGLVNRAEVGVGLILSVLTYVLFAYILRTQELFLFEAHALPLFDDLSHNCCFLDIGTLDAVLVVALARELTIDLAQNLKVGLPPHCV